jgi:hypothetical protein
MKAAERRERVMVRILLQETVGLGANRPEARN